MDQPFSNLARSGAHPRKTDEFFPGAERWPNDLNRRDFLQVMGASLALAGLNSCGRGPNDKLVPYVIPPEKNPTPESNWYATVMPLEGYARGVLAKSVKGRPIKLEGNPDHPESLGATDAVTQAAILGLYDPDRSAAPSRSGQIASWGAFEREWISRREFFQPQRGAGLAILTEPTTSPTQLREIHALLDAWPETQWFQHSPLVRYDRKGTQPDFDFAAAKIILSLGSDCFQQHPAALRYLRAFSSRRRIERGQTNFNRLYALEPTLSLTGNLADVRLTLAPGRFPVVLNALAVALDHGTPSGGELTLRERALVDDFTRHVAAEKNAVCVVGGEMPDELHAWADAFNRRFGGAGVQYLDAGRSDGDPRSRGGLSACVAAIEGGAVSALWVLGSNPVYTRPADLDVVGALRRAAFSVHVGEFVDETSAHCRWHLPESHFLETWSDLKAYSGAPSIQQPLIEPIHATRSVSECLRLIRTGEPTSAYDLVRETWRAAAEGGGADFDVRWHRWLNRGVIDDLPAPPTSTVAQSSRTLPTLSLPERAPGFTILLRPDPNVADGRWSNNAWLQELPRPFSSLVWENAAILGTDDAAKLSLKRGDIIALNVEGAALEVPVWILPGQASGCITLHLGYGRTAGGETGYGRGFSAYLLRTAKDSWQRQGVTVRRTNRSVVLVSTQEHFTMEGRDLARVMTVAELTGPRGERESGVSLFPEWPKDRYAWGMSIDLGTCSGCNACVIACQAENNIPVVGRDQVARGREMHWIRVDRYFTGEDDHPRVLHQPVPCMHCENAPCEVVCPVAATVHSSEGLNDMVYNRCVGTRYCSNNCPYKVRRFNFLDYRAAAGSSLYLQSNPDVTVRERGVMEKCSYCVQRINAARIAAEKENRRVQDGEMQTACQQACPAEAIVFGDLNDPASRVVQRKQEAVSYALLSELNTRPRTTYLAKLLPEPAIAGLAANRP